MAKWIGWNYRPRYRVDAPIISPGSLYLPVMIIKSLLRGKKRLVVQKIVTRRRGTCMRFIKHPRNPYELNITPPIDVVFIFLIFFAVSSTFGKDMQLELERPKPTSAFPASPSPLRIYLDRSGVILFNDTEIRPRMLQAENILMPSSTSGYTKQ